MIGNMRNKSGFTLVEIVVAAALFSMIMVAAVNLFVLFLREPLQQIDEFHVYEEINNVMAQLTSYSRDQMIDYSVSDYSSGFSNPQSKLYLVSTDATTSTEIYLSSGQLFATITTGTTPVTTPLTSNSSNQVFIDTFNVYVYPNSDPFDLAASPPNSQPAVVVHIVGHSVTDTSVTYTAQTLISTRVYER